MKPHYRIKCTPFDGNVARIQMIARRERKSRVPHTPAPLRTHLLTILTVFVVFGIIIL